MYKLKCQVKSVKFQPNRRTELSSKNKKMKTLIALIFLFAFFSCQSTNTAPSPKMSTATAPNDSAIPLAEKGITVVNPNGWTEQNMTFHLDYCAQMLTTIANEYDPTVFCPCFLDKIQYYYEPVYFKEAYADQKKWNEACMLEAQINK